LAWFPANKRRTLVRTPVGVEKLAEPGLFLDFLGILYPPDFGYLGGRWSFSTATPGNAN
jgi:hypothetical protein